MPQRKEQRFKKSLKKELYGLRSTESGNQEGIKTVTDTKVEEKRRKKETFWFPCGHPVKADIPCIEHTYILV